MPSCVAFGCTNRPGKKAGHTFHRFPKKKSIRAQWIIACRRKDWIPSKSSILCSDHFSEDLFDRTSLSSTRLRENAIPNQFPAFPPYLQNKTSACCKPASVSSSPPTKQEPSGGTLVPRIENVRSISEAEIDQNKPEATPTFSNYGKNDCDRNTVVIVSDTLDYKNALNSHSDTNSQIVTSDNLNLTNGTDNAFAHIENLGSTNDRVLVQQKPVATPTFSNCGKNDCDKNTVIIVSDTDDYKNVLNDHSDADRRIVISDQLNLKNIPGSAFAHIENVGSTNNKVAVQNKPMATQKTFSNGGKNDGDKNTMVIVSDTPNCKNILISHSNANPRTVISDQVNMYKNPLLLFDDEFHSQRIKELEEVFKALYKKKKNWNAKIRRMKRKLKSLRKEFIRYNKKNGPLLRCNSQPVVHFLALDIKNA